MMEGVDRIGMHQTSAFGSQFPRPPNPKPSIPPSHPNINVPPSNPHPQFLGSSSQQLHSLGSSHSRSLSQPSNFSPNSLPPLNLSPAATSLNDSISTTDMSLDGSMVSSLAPSPFTSFNKGNALQVGPSLPPRKGYSRYSNDSLLGISNFMQSPPPPPLVILGGGESSTKPIQLVLKASINDGDRVDEPVSGRKEDVVDDLFDEYMNLENINTVNFYGVEDKDLDRKASGSKTVESSDNKVESHVTQKTSGAQGASLSCSGERREGVKRSSNWDTALGACHRRSFSLLDDFIKNFQIENGLPKPPNLKNQGGQLSPTNLIDGKTSDIALEFGNGEFTIEELNKIMESDKLTKIALLDPKRAKRILANRQSAARSKERKMQYIAELEHKVQTLQTETTTLSTQFTKLQMDNSELKSENNEYKLRLQAMEQQSQLTDALNETLDAEVQRLRHIVTELGEGSFTSCMAQQHAVNQQMLPLQHQQPNQDGHFLLQNHYTQEESEPGSQQIEGNELHPQKQFQSQQI